MNRVESSSSCPIFKTLRDACVQNETMLKITAVVGASLGTLSTAVYYSGFMPVLSKAAVVTLIMGNFAVTALALVALGIALYCKPQATTTTSTSTPPPPAAAPAVTAAPAAEPIASAPASSPAPVPRPPLPALTASYIASLPIDRKYDITESPEEYYRDYITTISGATYIRTNRIEYIDSEDPLKDIYDERLDMTRVGTKFSSEKQVSRRTKEVVGFLNGILASDHEQLGVAVDNGDCFFDAIRQGLKSAGVADISTKQVRKDVAVFVRSLRGADLDAIKDITDRLDRHATWDEYFKDIDQTFDEIERENADIPRHNEPINDELNQLVDHINALRKTIREMKQKDKFAIIFDQEKAILALFTAYRRKTDELKGRKNPVWGMHEREGQIIADKYQVQIEVVSAYAFEGDTEFATDADRPQYKPKIGLPKATIKIALYDGHYLPVIKL